MGLDFWLDDVELLLFEWSLANQLGTVAGHRVLTFLMDVLAMDGCTYLSEDLGLLQHSDLRLADFHRNANFLATVVIPGVMYHPDDKLVTDLEVRSHD